MKYLVSIFFIFVFLLPYNIFAACNLDGLTIVYVNGILTSKGDAENDRGILQDNFKRISGRTDIKFINGYNESHGGGAGDIVQAASQIFNSPISNYDRDTILLQIHPEVKTRKILLVGHSQGTFYTNEMYNYLIANGVAKESIAVYNIATPAGSVSGDGEYLTSQNDKVINLVRNLALRAPGAKQPLTANIVIPSSSADSLGHSFGDVYLGGAPLQIVSKIDSALKKLAAGEAPGTAEGGCFVPPAKDIAYYAQKSAFFVADSAVDGAAAAGGTIAMATHSTVTMAAAGVQNTFVLIQAIGEKSSGFVSQALNLMVGAASSVIEAINEKAKLASVIDSLGGLFSVNKNQGLNLAATVDLNAENNEAEKSDLLISVKKFEEDKADAADGESISLQDFINDTQNEDGIIDLVNDADLAKINAGAVEKNIYVAEQKPVPVCKFATSQSPLRQKLIINELAWMGGVSSANDEWIELRNISGGELDISGWQILDKEEQIKITFSRNTKIENGGYILLERTDDDSVPETKADAVYAGALANADEGLRLYDGDCNLSDEILADTGWPAGDSGARKTMERLSDLSWHTYNGSGITLGGMFIFGTPKRENSQLSVTSTSVSSASAPAAAATTSPSEAPAEPSKILISEIQITGGTGKTNNDFIELYNPNSMQVNLNGYRLVKRAKIGTTDTSIKSWTSDAYIPAKGYYLWANNDYAAVASVPDITTSAILANDNGVAIRYGSEDTGALIDSVSWGSAANSFSESQSFAENPTADQSISRRTEIDGNDNSADFMKSRLSPKNSGTSGGFIAPIDWNSQSAAPSGHILISEAYPDRTGANRDFLELYNPNPAEDISGWSLQILSANATSTDKITKKNFVSGNQIPESGFFLVGIDDYADGDMSWASGSLNSSDGATIFLVNATTTIEGFDDPRIVDRIAYGSGTGSIFPETAGAPLPAIGKSLERKALHEGLCISAAGVDSSPSSLQAEFLGNGCDTDDNSINFEERSAPSPQSSDNLIEPRLAPSAINNFIAAYSTTTLQIILQWDPSQDFAGATSTINYAISYATSTSVSLKDLAILTATTSYNFKINEVGVAYQFSIIAKDRDGMSSDGAAVDLVVPSIFNSAYMYPDPRNPGVNSLELNYSSYPFINNPYQDGDSWRVLIAYKNQEAPAIPFFYSGLPYATTPDGVSPKEYGEWGTTISGAWKLSYSNCASSLSNSSALILPDTDNQCSANFGGVRNSSLNRSRFGDPEDLNLIIPLAENQAPPAEGDYVTFGLYGFSGSNVQTLLAVDRQKYNFQNAVPAHSAPSAPENLELSFNPTLSLLRIVWDVSSDPDTLDSNLVYEMNYSSADSSAGAASSSQESGWIAASPSNYASGEYSEVQGRPLAKIILEPNLNYEIAIRAKDDFGNISEAATAAFLAPDLAPPFGISDIRWGNFTDATTTELIFSSDPYPFMTAEIPSAMIFFLNQSPPVNYNFSNSDDPTGVSKNNKVLRLKYNSCIFGADYDRYAAFVFNNLPSCAGSGQGIKGLWAGKDIIPGQSIFTAKVIGAYDNGIANTDTFSATDYVTVGFYELSGNDFNQVAVYNRKIYFQEY